jgi:hypothetical protein
MCRMARFGPEYGDGLYDGYRTLSGSDRIQSVQYSSGDVTSPSWISHWERTTGLSAGTCCVFGCSTRATRGAHVWVNRIAGTCYIVPTCRHHNSIHGDREGVHPEDGYVSVKKGTRAVPIKALSHFERHSLCACQMGRKALCGAGGADRLSRSRLQYGWNPRLVEEGSMHLR